jgi:hypothetical protein
LSVDISKIKHRVEEAYLIDHRNSSLDSYRAWHERIAEVDRIIRGDWTVQYPDGTSETLKPMVQNTADTFVRDASRLVGETTPTVKAPKFGDGTRAANNAAVRNAIADTHWQANNGDILNTQWTMDLLISGVALSASWVDTKLDYPHITRIDPRNCYPDVQNGMLSSLLVLQKVKARILQAQFPDLPILNSMTEESAEEWEVWDYYSADECVKAVSQTSRETGMPMTEDGVHIAHRYNPELDCPPIGFVMLPSPDGGFRGLIDQSGDALATKNRIVKYLMDYSHQLIYAPWERKNITNDPETVGPNTWFEHNPEANESFVRRVSPATSNPLILNLLNYLDTEQRLQLTYPSSRGGEVSQSQASGSFISSTQGTLTSVVRDIQRLLAQLRRQTHYIGFQYDVAKMDYEKPLSRSVEAKTTYLPSKDIKDKFYLNVVYGAGAGLDRQSTDVRLQQYFGNGVISEQTLLENVDFILDPRGEMDMREREELRKVILQRAAGDPSMAMEFLIEVLGVMDDKGFSFSEALRAVQEAGVKAQQPQGAQAQGTPEAQAGATAEEQQVQIEKGAVPGGGYTPAPPTFTPPPYGQVFTRNT